MVLSICISISFFIIGIIGGICYYRNKDFNDYMKLTCSVIKDAKNRNDIITCNYLYRKYCNVADRGLGR